MTVLFYISSLIALLATVMVITHLNAVHALLYLIVSLLAVALVFFTLGAPFVAALEIIIYAGAIMVLFLFVIMTLNLGPHAIEQEREWLRPSAWIFPALLSTVLILELIYMLAYGPRDAMVARGQDPKAVAFSLFGPYVLGVELASILLMAGLIGAYHLGRQIRTPEAKEGEIL